MMMIIDDQESTLLQLSTYKEAPSPLYVPAGHALHSEV